MLSRGCCGEFHNGDRPVGEMKVPKQRIGLILIFASYGAAAPCVAPLLLDGTCPYRTTEREESTTSLAVYNEDQAKQQSLGTANPPPFEKLAESARTAMASSRSPAASAWY